jgi:hypothetical protein
MIRYSVLAASVSAWSLTAQAGFLEDFGKDSLNIVKASVGEVSNCFQGGCDPVVAMSKFVQGQTTGVSSSLVGPAKEAFDDSMKKAFAEHINPAISMINGMIVGEINLASSEVNRAIEKVHYKLGAIIAEAGDTANSVTEKAVDQVREEIVEKTFSELSILRVNLKSDINEIFNKIEQLGEKIDCSVEGYISGVRTDLINRLGANALPNPFDQCRKDLKLGFVPGIKLNNPDLYLLTLCHTKNEISPDMQVTQILGKLAAMQSFASKLRCHERMAGKAVEWYTDRMIEIGSEYNAIRSWK